MGPLEPASPPPPNRNCRCKTGVTGGARTWASILTPGLRVSSGLSGDSRASGGAGWQLPVPGLPPAYYAIRLPAQGCPSLPDNSSPGDSPLPQHPWHLPETPEPRANAHAEGHTGSGRNGHQSRPALHTRPPSLGLPRANAHAEGHMGSGRNGRQSRPALHTRPAGLGSPRGRWPGSSADP